MTYKLRYVYAAVMNLPSQLGNWQSSCGSVDPVAIWKTCPKSWVNT